MNREEETMPFTVDSTVVIIACSILMQGHFALATVYSMELCQSDVWTDITGGDVFSQFEPCYSAASTTNCTLALKAPEESMQLMVHFIELDIEKQEPCIDQLTLQEVADDQQLRPLLAGFCGSLVELQGKAVLYTRTSRLLITWQTSPHGQANQCHRGFHLIVTAVLQTPEVCPASGFVQCNDNNCIPETLRCDGTTNCVNGEDELGCRMDIPAAANFQNDGMVWSTSMLPLTSGSPSTGDTIIDESVYLWLPLIIVLVFTGIMVTLVLLGRRTHSYQTTLQDAGVNIDHGMVVTPVVASSALRLSSSVSPVSTTLVSGGSLEDVDAISITLVLLVFALILIVCMVVGWREKRAREYEEQQRPLRVPIEANLLTQMNESLTLDINSNPSYGDEPVTPPPRYSYLERQMSFTSNISQTSDQLSIPPDYEEAIELTGNGRPRRSRLSRSSTGSARRNRSRLFSRPPAQDVSRPSTAVVHSGSLASDAEPRLSVSSDYSDVFINGQRASPPPSIISEESGEEENIVAPSMMRNPYIAGAASPQGDHHTSTETTAEISCQPVQATSHDHPSVPTSAIPDTHTPQL